MKKKKFLYFLIALYLVGCNGVYKYDNEKAVEYITEHKEQKSKCMCAWYTMKAIRNGGCYNCYIYPAYSYNKMLVQLGFEEVFNGGNYTPLKGDISVLPRNSHSVFGHIAIYNGEKWISDFEQKSIFPGKAYSEKGEYQIYRINDGWHYANVYISPLDFIQYVNTLLKGINKIKW